MQVYRVELRPDKSVPLPQELRKSKTSAETLSLDVAVAAVVLVFVAGATYWFSVSQSEETPWTTQFPLDSGGRGFSRVGVKMVRINLRLEIPNRWHLPVIEEEDLKLQGFETSPELLQCDFGRQLDGTLNSEVFVATDRDDVAHFRVFKVYEFIHAHTDEAAIKWMQERGVQLVIDRYRGATSYDETRGPIEEGTLGSGGKMTMIPSTLRINEEERHVRTVIVLRKNSATAMYEYVVFFFHNGSDTRQIDLNEPLYGSLVRRESGGRAWLPVDVGVFSSV